MARRRLSDLLREEANKPSDETTAEVEQSADEPDAEDADGAGETAAIASSAPSKASTTAKTRATKRTEATEPDALPEPTHQDETLLQKIADLTLALEAQKETIEQLQTDLEQTRKDARQLADSNASLTQELKTLQTKKAEADTSALEKKAESRPYQELRLSSPPIAATSNPTNSFNKDVGWFD